MGMMFRVASGREDFEAVADLWTRRYGQTPSALARFRMLIQTGSLIVTQDGESDRIIGAVPLDFLSFDNTLLVPFNLVPEEDDGRVLRRQIQLVLQATIHSAVGRILFYADEGEEHRRMIWQEFDACLAERQLPVSLEIPGAVEDYFGDNDDPSVSSLFIRRAERPDLGRKAPATVDATIRTASELSRDDPPEFLAKVKRGTTSKSADRQKDKEQSDKDPGEKDPFEKDKDRSDKDPGEKDPFEKPLLDEKDFEKPGEKGAGEKDGDNGDNGDGDGGGGKEEGDKGDPGEKGEEQDIVPDRRGLSGPSVEIDLIGTRQAIVYREIGVSFPASLGNVADADRRAEV